MTAANPPRKTDMRRSPVPVTAARLSGPPHIGLPLPAGVPVRARTAYERDPLQKLGLDPSAPVPLGLADVLAAAAAEDPSRFEGGVPDGIRPDHKVAAPPLVDIAKLSPEK